MICWLNKVYIRQCMKKNDRHGGHRLVKVAEESCRIGNFMCFREGDVSYPILNAYEDGL